MARVNQTLSGSSSRNSEQIDQVQLHWKSVNALLMKVMVRQSDAQNSIRKVSSKIEQQMGDLKVRKDEIKLLAMELNSAQQKISKLLHIQQSQHMDRDTIARRITSRNEEIARIDHATQESKTQLDLIQTRMNTVHDNYDKVFYA